MKVKELLEDLKHVNPEAEVKFATGFFDKELEVLSVYSDGYSNVEIDPKSKILWIDLG